MKKIIIESDFESSFTVYAVSRRFAAHDFSLHTRREDAERQAAYMNKQEGTVDYYVYARTVFHDC